MLPQELRTFDYYLKKLPLYLKNSEGFTEHFKIWFDLLMGNNDGKSGICPSSEAILEMLNIFDENYLNYINELANSTHQSDILDKLAAYFCCRRNFTVEYDDGPLHFKKSLRLDNRELLMLIQSRIIHNFCDGSYEQLKQYYKKIGLDLYIITAELPATCYLYMVNAGQYSNNIEILFKSGMLRIESVGITYQRRVHFLPNALHWDIAFGDFSNRWDEGVWTL